MCQQCHEFRDPEPWEWVALLTPIVLAIALIVALTLHRSL